MPARLGPTSTPSSANARMGLVRRPRPPNEASSYPPGSCKRGICGLRAGSRTGRARQRNERVNLLRPRAVTYRTSTGDWFPYCHASDSPRPGPLSRPDTSFSAEAGALAMRESSHRAPTIPFVSRAAAKRTIGSATTEASARQRARSLFGSSTRTRARRRRRSRSAVGRWATAAWATAGRP